MVSIPSLIVPILVSAVIVFLASWIFHAILTYHHNDFRKLPSEDEVQEALRRFNIPPGDYMLPKPANMQDMKNPAYLAKREKGPVLITTVFKGGKMTMGPQLLQWFIYCVVVSIFAAYLAGRTQPTGTPYLAVFRVAGTVAFCSYVLAGWQDSIWYKRAVSTTVKNTVDGLIYGLLTGGVFGWLWPR